jgi:conjugative relaxase-like TrwC/TraI family protein
MLSIKPFSSSDAASKYYSHGDYYGSEGEGSWLGLGAKDLGLSGDITAKTNKEFNNLLKGILPNGQVLGRKTKDGTEHTPGVDLTFSAPKSFSIQMLLYSSSQERQGMEQALKTAVSKTLSYIESKGYVVARKGNGGYEREKLNKLTFATFMHTTNRNLEPQMHVHCFLANAAKCQDGKFRSITIDNLLENNKLFGQAFRNELALETKKLGLEITHTILSDGSSSFEIASVHPKIIEAFSTRRKEIVGLCKLYGVTTKEGRDKIVINSRKAKKLVTKEELTKAWYELENKIKQEIDAEQNSSNNKIETSIESRTLEQQTHLTIQQNLKDKDIANTHNKTYTPQDTSTSAVSSVISFIQDIKEKVSSLLSQNKDKTGENETLSVADLTKLSVEDVSYNKTVFLKEELLKKSLKYGIGNYSVLELHQEINNLEQNGSLIRHENQLTTRTLLEKENQILKYARDKLGSSKEIVTETAFVHHCQKFEKRELAKNPEFQMNRSQQKAIKHILTSKDKIITMEGLPGVGKSTVLNAVRDITDKRIINLIDRQSFEGMAPTASAAKTLKGSAKVETQTLHGFITKYQGYIEGRGMKSLSSIKQEYKNTIIFVDEASLISTNIMHRLLTLQDKLNFRLVLTGDTKQLGSVEAGKPFEQMLDIIKPVRLRQIVRQKNDAHKQAVLDSATGNIEGTFAIHDDSIKATQSIAIEVANLYLSQSSRQRENTLLISPTRILRDQINNQIREKLDLKSDVINFTALKPKDMSKEDYNFASSYSVGDILKFSKEYSNGINKGDYLKVKTIHHISNNLVLERANELAIERQALKDQKDLKKQKNLKEQNQKKQQNQEKPEKEIIFSLKKDADYSSKIEVFTKITLNLQEGLKIIITKNNKDYGLINSETSIIEKINKDNITMKFEDGKSTTVPINQLKHIDYGYCVTVHNAQGKTYENTIAAISNNKLLNNQKMWLVALSRHKKEFSAFVEDKNQLKSYLMKNSGAELSAIELNSKAINNEISSKNLQPSITHAKIKDTKEIEL